jgi:serine/threonine-protein kinase RsbT
MAVRDPESGGAGASELVRAYDIQGGDFAGAGRASIAVKDLLKSLGVAPDVVRRVAIAAYEAEMNVVMYATRGRLTLRLTPVAVALDVEDEGPGIADIALAMQEGYSTATPEMREMGFGAGMGLPNIERMSDEFTIASTLGVGTRLAIRVRLPGGEREGPGAP